MIPSCVRSWRVFQAAKSWFTTIEKGNHIPAAQSLLDGYAVLDFETTGLDPDSGDRVVQVAVVKLGASGEYEGAWSSLVNPERDMGAEDVHGITNEDISDAPTFQNLWPFLANELEGRFVVGQNVKFDLGFLFKELEILTPLVEFPSIVFFDNMQLAHKVISSGNRRQRVLAAALGIDYLEQPGKGPHDALTDAHVAARVFQHYLANWPDLVAANLNSYHSGLKLTRKARG